MDLKLMQASSSPFVILPWKSLSPGTAKVSHGCFPFPGEDEKTFQPLRVVGISHEEISNFVSEVEKIAIGHLAEIEKSLKKCHKWHLILLGSGGLGAPVLLPKIYDEGAKVYRAIGGRQPALFQSISGSAVAEAVRLGFSSRNLYVSVRGAINGSFCLILSTGTPIPPNLIPYNTFCTPYPERLHSVRLHAHDGSLRNVRRHLGRNVAKRLETMMKQAEQEEGEVPLLYSPGTSLEQQR